MKVSTHTRSLVVGLLDQATSLGLKLGVPVVVVSLAFLLAVVFGGHLQNMAKATTSEKAYLTDGVSLAARALAIAGVVVVASLVVRFSRIELTGQLLSLAGAVLYFGTPILLAWVGSTADAGATRLLVTIVRATRSLGGISLLAGLALVLRDAILRIWTGISVKRVIERRWGDEEDQRKKRRKPSVIASCWDMPFCRDFVRDVCPAYAASKSCWRIKVGCYCDEATIIRAMTSGGKDNVHARGILESLGLDKPAQSRLSNKLKRERCRRCGIYAEHQRQKYRLLSPMVFPAIFLLLYAYYPLVSTWVWRGLEKADRFMSFMTYRTGSAYSFGDDGRILTTLAIAWLTIIAISYALRALEYTIFELQV